MKRVLLTGANGFLGKVVLQELLRRNRYMVHAVTSRKGSVPVAERVKEENCDLTDSIQVQGLIERVRPDILIHLAWDQTSADFRMSDKNLLWLTVSMNLLYEFHHFGGGRFLFAGSSSEYDGEAGVFAEEVDVLPVSLYGQCKKNFSTFGQQYCKGTNVSFVSLRYFTIYGAGDPHTFGAIPSTLRKLREGEAVTCNSPLTTRDYIYVGDAARITVELAEHEFEGIVNVASGVPRTMEQVFTYIAQCMGKEELLAINTNNREKHIFEADISLLKRLGLERTISDFEENMKHIVDNV